MSLSRGNRILFILIFGFTERIWTVINRYVFASAADACQRIAYFSSSAAGQSDSLLIGLSIWASGHGAIFSDIRGREKAACSSINHLCSCICFMRVCTVYLDFYRFAIYSRYGRSSRNGYFKSERARLVFGFGFNSFFSMLMLVNGLAPNRSGCWWTAADDYVVARSIWCVSSDWCTNVFCRFILFKRNASARTP